MAEGWETTLRTYAWVPEISQKAPLTLPSGEFVVPKSKVLETLDMTFMGNIELRKDRWVLLADIVYSNNSDKRENTLGIGRENGFLTIETQARAKMKSWTYNVGVGYNLFDDNGSFADLLVGVRYVDVETTLQFTAEVGIPEADLQRKALIKDTTLDGFVGLRGEFIAGDRWFLPYHLDMGAGDSDFTIQAFAGAGYRFGNSAVTAGYRYLRFDQDVTVDDQSTTNKLSYQGPSVGYSYTF